MASAIRADVPSSPHAFTADMRANFAAAKSEIEALQQRLAAFEAGTVDYLTRVHADRTYAPAGLAADVAAYCTQVEADLAAINRRLDTPPPADPRYGPLAAEVARLREDFAAVCRFIERGDLAPAPGNMRTILLADTPSTR